MNRSLIELAGFATLAGLATNLYIPCSLVRIVRISNLLLLVGKGANFTSRGNLLHVLHFINVLHLLLDLLSWSINDHWLREPRVTKGKAYWLLVLLLLLLLSAGLVLANRFKHIPCSSPFLMWLIELGLLIQLSRLLTLLLFLENLLVLLKALYSNWISIIVNSYQPSSM